MKNSYFHSFRCKRLIIRIKKSQSVLFLKFKPEPQGESHHELQSIVSHFCHCGLVKHLKLSMFTLWFFYNTMFITDKKFNEIMGSCCGNFKVPSPPVFHFCLFWLPSVVSLCVQVGCTRSDVKICGGKDRWVT